MLQDRFIFTGPVPDVELAAYYRASSVYVSLSEHEGFCVPLVEAMAMDVPVLAYSAAAVPDTLGGAGVQFAPKDLDTRPSCSACLHSRKAHARKCWPASGGGFRTSATPSFSSGWRRSFRASSLNQCELPSSSSDTAQRFSAAPSTTAG